MMMTWYKKEILTLQDVKDFIDKFKEVKPLYGGFDTETDGLHIIRNHPFLLIFGFVDLKKNEGHTYLLDLDEARPLFRRIAVDNFITEFNKLKRVVAWNAKYDLHMMTNFGRPNLFEHNITDAQIYARLAHDAIPEKEGGVPMKLKDYATRYIDKNARYMSKKVAEERKRLKVLRNKRLQEMLNEKTGKKWPMYKVEAMLSDKVLGLDNVPREILPIIREWLDTTPDPDNYRNISREIVKQYAHMDVIYTLEAFLQCLPMITERLQEKTVEREERLIYPLYRMERVGFAFNRDYAYESKEKLKRYILEKRKELILLAKEDITVGQHAKIKEILNDEYDLDLPSTGSSVLENIEIENEDAKYFIQTISELRTLEKWYSTYIIKWINEEVNGRVYTTIHSTGAVSGRVTSDFQQFPQNPIYDSNDQLLFHPRKLIKVTGNDYPITAYLDYSQIELRFQGIYTILVNGGDVNLCRAYMPFHCIERDGKWYLEEDPSKEWVPTDLHSLTTKMAFGVDENHPDWKKLRKMGKQTNFACNYGANAPKLVSAMYFEPRVAEKLYKAYVNAFPGVRAYRNYVQQLLAVFPYGENLFGRKYYGSNAHKVSNYLVQGSAADFLKDKIIEIDAFLLTYKSRFQMNIHDELSFEIHKDEMHIIPKLKQIMEDLPGTKVPIVADIEITYTTWDEKEDYELTT